MVVPAPSGRLSEKFTQASSSALTPNFSWVRADCAIPSGRIVKIDAYCSRTRPEKGRGTRPYTHLKVGVNENGKADRISRQTP